MKRNSIYNGLNNAPINMLASRVLARGESYNFKNNEPHREESDTPLSITWGKIPHCNNFVNLTGRKVGRLTVVGWNHKKSRWVCRCSCGIYVYRTSKAIKNDKNKADACFQCTKLIDIKRLYHFEKTGRWIERASFYDV